MTTDPASQAKLESVIRVPAGGDAAVQVVAPASKVSWGDASTLAGLYDSYGKLAYGLAVRILRDPALAEAAVASAFSTFAGVNGSFATGTSAQTAVLTEVHRHAVEARRSTPERSRPKPPLAPGADDGASGLLESERERVRSALSRLPDDQRRALELSYFDGLSLQELAERRGESVGIVRETLRAGLYKFKELLAEPATQRA